MKAYSIFDDFDPRAVQLLRDAGVDLTVHPLGVPRPDEGQMKEILRRYDCVILGTSQKITEAMWDGIESPRILATASAGLDHIRVPKEKMPLVTVLNTPTANAQSVAEYTMGCALSCVKRLTEGRALYAAGKNNKALHAKPEDLAGKTMGVVGAGNISRRIIQYARMLGMQVLCWTRNPGRHPEIEDEGASFAPLDQLLSQAGVLSVNLPNTAETRGFISARRVEQMREDAVFISVSRLVTVDADALLRKAAACPGFYVCLDVDVEDALAQKMPALPNVLITPHIAGGTVETRKRMFVELARKIAAMNTH